MDILLSAVLGELTTRSINFFVRHGFKPSTLDVEDLLCRTLLRAQVIVDEAMGRQITNQAMLQQLDMLREAMHRGYYILDTFRYQSHNKEETKGQVLSHSFSVSKVKTLQGFCSSTRNTHNLKQLQKSLDLLRSMIHDVEHLLVFLMSYPRIYRQPYSMHLLLGNCMFGRQMETELVINFLLHSQPHDSYELEVLPIVGPGKVGKSTLVAHVCKDERVCERFTKILYLHDRDATGENISAFKERSEMEHQSHVSNSNRDRRLLVVVELVFDHNEDTWNSLYSAFIHHVPKGSKIIVTSRFDKIIKFGTTKALCMNYLSHEAYWYFFKVLTFGSIDPQMHPRHTHLAMEIAQTLNGCIIGANMTAFFLRDNFDIHLWHKALAFNRGQINKNVTKSGTYPFDLINQKRPAYLERMAIASEDFVLHCEYQCSSQEEVPKISIHDVIYGSVKAHGKFKILGWSSRIPPYHSYIYTCEIRKLKSTAPKRKRCMKN